MTQTDRPHLAALVVLILLQLIMLSALYAGVPPHPPIATPLFGIGPFIGASVSAAVAAIVLGESRAGRVMALLAVLGALVSFGPQKYLDPQFPLIWPAVIAAQLAAITVLARLFPALSRKGA